MARYQVGDGFAMEATETGLVKLSIGDRSMFVDPDEGDEIRALLAIAIAEARGRQT